MSLKDDFLPLGLACGPILTPDLILTCLDKLKDQVLPEINKRDEVFHTATTWLF